MTISEFQAFLEGMDVEECPTPEQWARIKEKVEALQPLHYWDVTPPMPSTIYWQAPTPYTGPNTLPIDTGSPLPPVFTSTC